MVSKPQALIISATQTATTDYFLKPHLVAQGYAVTILPKLNQDFITQNLEAKVCVISRYINAKQLKLLADLKQLGVKIIYFMDDDLFDWRAWSGLPYSYRWKLFTQAYLHKQHLLNLADEFWCSTDFLVQKYADFNPKLLLPVATTKTIARREIVTVAYHGTASHTQEIYWLINIIQAVQAQTDNVQFELFGTHKINKLVAKFPRVAVLHPMNWDNYLNFTATHKCEIALAPLLENKFNSARGYTKFYDYARLGAVGLYSDIAPYKGFIRDGIDGFLLANDSEIWVDKILELALDNVIRNNMLDEIKQRNLQNYVN